jgi:hypothetical protein
MAGSAVWLISGWCFCYWQAMVFAVDGSGRTIGKVMGPR